MSPLATYLVETLVTLLGIVGLAFLVLVGGRRIGLGRSTGPLELIGKLPLDPPRAGYLVRVGKLVYVLAAAEGGVVRLGELPAGDLPEPTAPVKPSMGFRAVLDRIRGSPSRTDAITRERP
jgi:hypothetical protein